MKDEAGTPTPQDTDGAKKFTEGLRARAKLGSGPYIIAGNSEKELIDEKLLKNCDTEADKCMAQIGSDLGADFLMFGRIEKKGGSYTITMKLLDVHQRRLVKSSTDTITLADASNDVKLSERAQQIYAKLTGEKTTGTLVVKVTNADRGTILIGSEEKGTITSGSGQVTGLEENRYKLAIESEGFHRWEDTVTVKAGETTTKTVTLDKNAPLPGGGNGGGIIEPPGGGGIVGPGGDGGGGGTRGNAMWKGVFVGSIVVGLAGGGMWVYGKQQIDSATKDLQDHCGYASAASCNDPNATKFTTGQVSDANSKGDRGHTLTIAGSITVGVGGALALVAFYEGFIAKNDSGRGEHVENGHRVRRDRFVVTPIIAPNGGGATLQFDW